MDITNPKLWSADYYVRLGLSRSASEVDIKQRYRRLALYCHPDKGGDKDVWLALDEAYQVLSNKESRLKFDSYGTDLEPGVGNEMEFGISNLVPFLTALMVGILLAVIYTIFGFSMLIVSIISVLVLSVIIIHKHHYPTALVGLCVGFFVGCIVLWVVLFLFWSVLWIIFWCRMIMKEFLTKRVEMN